VLISPMGPIPHTIPNQVKTMGYQKRKENKWYDMWESPWFGKWKEDEDTPMRVIAAGQTPAASSHLAQINDEKPRMTCERICANCELDNRNNVVAIVQTLNDDNAEVKLPQENLAQIKTVEDFSSLLTEKELTAGKKWNSMGQVLVDTNPKP
jgi:hypothetical protein